MSILKVVCVSKYFKAEETLDCINFDIDEGEFVCIIGPSGCGKSTLLRIIACLETADEGSILFKEKEIDEAKPKIGMMFQSFALFPWMTVLDNVKFGLKMSNMPDKEAEKIAEKQLEMVGLGKWKNAYPSELSGGMKQRVGMARALSIDPDLLLLDEPFSALDAQTSDQLRDDLLRIWQETKKTIIMVSHTIEEVVYLADKTIVLSARPGRVVGEVPISLMLKRPRNKRSEEFFKVCDQLRSLIK